MYNDLKHTFIYNTTCCFREAREDLKKVRGEELSLPVLAFHGTKSENIVPICESGFKVPGHC